MTLSRSRTFSIRETPTAFGALVSITIALALFAFFHGKGFDDPFITYRYAYNIAHDHGFVYNAGSRVLSTTTPLYAIILSTIEMIGLPIPFVSNAIGVVSLALGGFVLWQLGRIWRTPAVGLVGLLLYPTFPLTISTLGAETTFYVALILTGILAYVRRRYLPAAVLLAAATLTRADAVVAAGILAADYLLNRRERPLPWAAIAAYVTVLAPWIAFAWWYFGAPLPVTLTAKQAQGQMAISQTFWEGAGMYVQQYWQNQLYRLHFVALTIGLVAGIGKWHRWMLIPAWAAGYFVAYVALGVSRYFWYYVPVAVGAIILMALGVESWRYIVEQLQGSRLATATTAVLAVLLLAPQLASVQNIQHHEDPRLDLYERVGDWLDSNTPQEASVATLEVGIIGYYSHRRMIGFAGLLQPATARQIAHETTYGDTALWAIQEFRPDYLALQDGLFSQVEQASAVRSACGAVQRFNDEEYAFPMIIYECSWE